MTEATNCLDLMTAFADVSSDPVFVRPRFGPVMHVKSSRHPILDKMDLPGKPEIISNDITATPIEANFQVITGPNMSGKSTYLKQIVLLQVMAQSGCFVPAFNEPQPMFRMADSIFSRVGMMCYWQKFKRWKEILLEGVSYLIIWTGLNIKIGIIQKVYD